MEEFIAGKPPGRRASSAPGQNSPKHLILSILSGANRMELQNTKLLGRIWEKTGTHSMEVRSVFLVLSSKTPLTYGPSLAISRL